MLTGGARHESYRDPVAAQLATSVERGVPWSSRWCRRVSSWQDITGDHRLAAHLAEDARLAAPDDAEVAQAHAEVFARFRDAATSTMAKGVYGAASRILYFASNAGEHSG